MAHDPPHRTIAAAMISFLVAALATVAFYVALVIVSFFVPMPFAFQSAIFVGSLLAVVFVIGLVLTFRRVRGKLRPKVHDAAQVPVHLWIVAGLAAISYGSAAVAYVATGTGRDVIAGDPTSYQHISYPVWVDTAFVCGVSGGLVGSLLLLVHRRYAVLAFGVSVAGLLVKAVYVRALGPTFDAQNFIAVQAVVFALLFLFYAWRMQRQQTRR